jgi:hypothetical protein
VSCTQLIPVFLDCPLVVPHRFSLTFSFSSLFQLETVTDISNNSLMETNKVSTFRFCLDTTILSRRVYLVFQSEYSITLISLTISTQFWSQPILS